MNFEANLLPLTDEQRAKFDKEDESGNKYQLMQVVSLFALRQRLQKN